LRRVAASLIVPLVVGVAALVFVIGLVALLVVRQRTKHRNNNDDAAGVDDESRSYSLAPPPTNRPTAELGDVTYGQLPPSDYAKIDDVARNRDSNYNETRFSQIE
jgi:hypothetical protein